MSSPELDDRARVDSLLDAQTKAERLFDEVEPVSYTHLTLPTIYSV